jgi:ABC-type nitrate/sulfonate/bicarbonate transport system ATPase subunit
MHRNLCRPRRSKRHLTILAVTLVVCRSPPEHRVQENAAATRVALSADELAELHSLIRCVGVHGDRYNATPHGLRQPLTDDTAQQHREQLCAAYQGDALPSQLSGGRQQRVAIAR